MPSKYVCGDCGYVLATDELVKSIGDVIKKYERKCPKCGKELVRDISKIEITPYGREIGPSEKNRPGQKNPDMRHEEGDLGI
ncbi:MAG: hypothetical protein NT016_03545 [Candidatus Aenigmarchaeota archaeon]|nr:hypothetical protein [Candidatus Aenigmarchaeota archaeon]